MAHFSSLTITSTVLDLRVFGITHNSRGGHVRDQIATPLE
jgi:hypothetical protein